MLSQVTKIGISNFSRLPQNKINNFSEEDNVLYREKIEKVEEYMKMSDIIKMEEKPTPEMINYSSPRTKFHKEAVRVIFIKDRN